jgi:hypothetical protein
MAMGAFRILSAPGLTVRAASWLRSAAPASLCTDHRVEQSVGTHLKLVWGAQAEQAFTGRCADRPNLECTMGGEQLVAKANRPCRSRRCVARAAAGAVLAQWLHGVARYRLRESHLTAWQGDLRFGVGLDEVDVDGPCYRVAGMAPDVGWLATRVVPRKDQQSRPRRA